jgi:hypothetical protein
LIVTVIDLETVSISSGVGIFQQLVVAVALKVIVPVPQLACLKLPILFTKTFGLSRSCSSKFQQELR